MTVNRLFVPLGAALWALMFVVRGFAFTPAEPVVVPPAPIPELASSVPQQPPPQPATGGAYAGTDTCLTCHEGQSLAGTPHARTADARTPTAQRGCETCHGPGQAHVDAGGDASLIVRMMALSPSDVSATCTTCHNRGDHAFWDGSQHHSRNLSCITCHSVHDPKSENGQLVKASAMAVCAQCHRDKVAKVDRSGHMPVREGKMSCATCHNPHGSANVKLLRAGFSSAETCTSCHADKRGPFLFEHAPVRESCATCHDPHGSPNDRMLVQKPPLLCQRCHSHTRHPGTLYDNRVVGSSNRLFARACVTCHSQIHGSNHASGHTFLR